MTLLAFLTGVSACPLEGKFDRPGQGLLVGGHRHNG